MFKNNKAHIYVIFSAWEPHQGRAGSGGKSSGSSLSLSAYKWSILVDPAKDSTFASYRANALAVVYTLGRSRQSNQWISVPKASSLNIDPLGLILIGRPAPATTVLARSSAALRKSLKMPDVEVDALEADVNVVWLRTAIRRLQEEGLVGALDIDSFLAFALDYACRRDGDGDRNGESRVLRRVDYAARVQQRVQQEAQQKAQQQKAHQPVYQTVQRTNGGFWVSYPQERRRSRGGWQDDVLDDPYGGLM